VDDATRLGRCSRCGAQLPADLAEGLCPACLMAAAAEAPISGLTGDEATVLSGTMRGASGTEPPILLGQPFGPYRVDRLLGRGGMGEVYEAEHLEHGRRVALKVLGHRLAGPDDRARFLREGQLAASISHPNTVYIFGSEEISGTPVISMELVAGGTLKDRVERDGPLKPSAAVDAILDVIAGLDAAQAGGILHRDIKPSNCFVDPEGRVKVGDFGLSISTLARDVGQRVELGGFQGTPQYAAPEQLKGQPLDLRADIYAVGATLYFLLTGHAPFEDRDLTTLVSRVTTETPASPRASRRGVPHGLAAIVVRCLAKQRADRPASYAELEEALRPFSSAAPTAAPLGLRLVAGGIDWLLLAAATVPLTLVPVLKFTPPASVDFSVSYTGATERDATLLAKVLVCLITFLYYALLEGSVTPRWASACVASA
jgi:eukaryotic-like serine/threonine-protein kinase